MPPISSRPSSARARRSRSVVGRPSPPPVTAGSAAPGSGGDASEWPLVFAWHEAPYLAARGHLYADLLHEAHAASAEEAAADPAAVEGAPLGRSCNGTPAEMQAERLPLPLRAAPHRAHEHLAYAGSRVVRRSAASVTYAHRFLPCPGGCHPAPRVVETVHTAGVDDVGGLCLPSLRLC